jgi:[acyl-carrier-protein] S-malonyltransferase
MSTAFIFPGQGSQSVGMGKALFENFAAARAVFEESDAALSQKLAALMFDGPEGELTLTRNAQPALMPAMLLSSPVIRSANIRRFAPRVPSVSRTPRGCCACAARRCKRR